MLWASNWARREVWLLRQRAHSALMLSGEGACTIEDNSSNLWAPHREGKVDFGL